MLELALLQQCAPNTDPIVIHSIVKKESSFNPYAIGVNKGGRIRQPKSYAQAVITAKRLLANGANIDLGLAQINSNNLNWLNLSVEDAFNPCTNLKAMQTVYNHCYERAGTNGLGTRMQRAFSCYNTGNFKRGFKNGYVNSVTKNYNHFKPIILQALNRPMPKSGGIELANYATQLQQVQQVNSTNADSSKNNEQRFETYFDASTEVSDQAPFVATTIADNSVATKTEQIKHSWDIFQDF